MPDPVKKEKASSNKKSALETKLFWSQKDPVWATIPPKEQKVVFQIAEKYKAFINRSRSERLAVQEIIRLAQQQGFHLVNDTKLEPNKDQLIFVEGGKTLALVKLGKQSITRGLRLIVSHLDSPRLDLKPRPLYEDSTTAYFKTHYYGGIKKFQWVNRPLALVGVVILQDGTHVEIEYGLNPQDPVFIINDLLIHLWGKSQAERKVPDTIKGEELNILVGGLPYDDSHSKNKVKLQVLAILNKKYGIIEEDLVSAELEIVPAELVRDVGFDRAFIAAYGHDDRSCSYCSMHAIFDVISSDHTVIAYFADKEEIGSVGVTGVQGHFLERIIAKLLQLEQKSTSYDHYLQVYSHSRAISADVTAGFDPNWANVHDKRNAARMGFGVAIQKYTGSRGKSGANDASAEVLGELRSIYNAAAVRGQSDELGKGDEGGGGTIAKFIAEYGIPVIDSGIPVWGMHSPYEIIHKCDLYMAYKGYHAFFTAPHK